MSYIISYAIYIFCTFSKLFYMTIFFYHFSDSILAPQGIKPHGAKSVRPKYSNLRHLLKNVIPLGISNIIIGIKYPINTKKNNFMVCHSKYMVSVKIVLFSVRYLICIKSYHYKSFLSTNFNTRIAVSGSFCSRYFAVLL